MRKRFRKALWALNRHPSYFEDAQVIASGEIWMVGAPTQEALRVVGQWPSPEVLLNRLIAELQRASEDADVPDEERSKLKRTAASLGTSAWQLALSALGGGWQHNFRHLSRSGTMNLRRTRKGWQEIPPKRCANEHELRVGTCTQHCICGRTHRTHTCRTCGDTQYTPPTGSACRLQYLDVR